MKKWGMAGATLAIACFVFAIGRAMIPDLSGGLVIDDIDWEGI